MGSNNPCIIKLLIFRSYTFKNKKIKKTKTKLLFIQPYYLYHGKENKLIVGVR